MKTISIHASRKYDVKIGSGLLETLGTEVFSVCKPAKAAIISDSNVYPLYGEIVKTSLEAAGINTVFYVFPAGEQRKNGNTYLEILNFLAENRLTRSDCIIALGGGVVGDMAGFAAATYLRGIPYIQVPTTLLAAVDSSVGGKTAIDLPAGKNLAGAFYQPALVLCDIDALKTLPEDIFKDGCAEVIKYAVLYDPQLFSHLQQHGLAFSQEWVIARCVELKRDVVMEDEFDTGARMKLNLGHTFAHGIEVGSDFTLTHGKAVAIGMAMIGRAAEKLGLCTGETAQSIENILNIFGLPTGTKLSAETILSYALSDKKRAGGTVNLIVPEAIGNCKISPISVEKLQAFIEAGM